MKTRKYKTLAGLLNSCDSFFQFTFWDFKRGVFRHKNGNWYMFDLPVPERLKVYHQVVQLIGGRKQHIINEKIRYYCTYHWFFTRIFIEKDRIVYCAGQDYNAEQNAIRKYLYNL